jgi:hypothetical protein
MIRKINALFSFCLDSISLLSGMISHAVLNRTKPEAYQALIRLFCRTQGKSNDFISFVLSMLHPATPAQDTSGILGSLTKIQLKSSIRELDEKGYVVFENAMDSATCEMLLQFSLSQAANLRGHSAQKIYSRAQPLAVRYDYSTKDLIENELVQTIMLDESILSLSAAYLRAQPILDLVAMWWHTHFQKEPDADAAQFFHFDMDRIKWLKFFFYVTDVRSENGPHCFISGTQRTGAIPKSLLNKGYARLSDEELKTHYGSQQFIEFTGKAGTIIAEDTRGFHKGKVVESGDRLVFQLQFSNSLFGATGEKNKISQPKTEKLKKLIHQRSRLLKNFL